MSLSSTATLMDTLYGRFKTIYAKWRGLSPNKSHLYETIGDRALLEILEVDVADLGLYFANADAQGAKAEYALTAECLAHLHAKEKPFHNNSRLESLIDEMVQHVRTHPLINRTPESGGESFYAPTSWRIAQFLSACGEINPTQLEAYQASLTDLAHHFMLRDGNVTAEEDERLKRFHAALNG